MKSFVLMAVMYHPSGNEVVSSTVIGIVSAESLEDAAEKLRIQTGPPCPSRHYPPLTIENAPVAAYASDATVRRLLPDDASGHAEHLRRELANGDQRLQFGEVPTLS